ncbi:MAG: sugar/nucleoside kinase (ribokinase family) [Pseudohongiellaceae bacterium]|jgi:sugar/nucleoside kinase (ribokinase family)
MSDKKYHIYGVGNALVDIEIETTDEQLTELKVEKGLMTLVDADRQHTLLEYLTGTQHKLAGGGSAANTIMALAHLGANCYYSCRVADDEKGQFFASDMREAGVETNVHIDKGNDGVTGTCLVMVTPDAERTMNTNLGISAELSTDQLIEDELAASEYLYIEGYLVSTPNSLETAMKAREMAAKHGVKVAMTFSDPAMVQFCCDGLRTVLGDGVDVLLCNETEAMGFTGCDTLDAAAEKLKESTRILAITCGADGSRIWDGERWLQIAAHPVKAVDTNGAGDLFAGAFLYGLTHGLDCETSARLASLGAATLVTHFGARLGREGLTAVKQTVLG